MSFLSDMFGGSSLPPVAPAPVIPSFADPAVQAEELLTRRRAGSGRASTLLTGPGGFLESVPGARTLLGAGYPGSQ